MKSILFSVAFATICTFMFDKHTLMFFPYNYIIIVLATFYLGYNWREHMYYLGLKKLTPVVALSTGDLKDPNVLQYKSIEDLSLEDFKYSSASTEDMAKAEFIVFLHQNEMKVLKNKNQIL